jgi:hypothetical protein
VWKREITLSELQVKDGWNIVDDNLLACSEDHRHKVFEMLKRQKYKPKFTGGLEAKLMTMKIATELRELKPEIMYFAYDTPDDLLPLIQAGEMLREVGFGRSHHLACYILIGFPNDTTERALIRIKQVIDAGFFPFAMLWRNENGDFKREWKQFQRQWANPVISADLENGPEGEKPSQQTQGSAPTPEQIAKMGKKTTKKEKIARILKVAELLMQGLTGPQILQYTSEKLKWGISDRTLDNYLVEAYKLFEKDALAHHSEEFGKALRRLNFLFANCLKIQDYKAALAMQREINEMMGFRNKFTIQAEVENKETIFMVDSSETANEFKRMKDELSKIDKRLPTDGEGTN